MAIKASGSSLAFSEIEAEFGQNNDRDLGEYRVSQTVGGLLNQPLDTSIPQSGEIKFSDFYTKRLNVIIDYHSGSTENRPTVAKTRYDATAGTGTHTVIGGFTTRPSNSSGTKTRIHVNKEIGSSNTNTNNCAVRTGTGWNAGTVLTVEVGSSGALYGAGGNGGDGGTSDSEKDGTNGSAGSSALGISYEGTTIINNGSIINGYGGGGGGGYRKVEREEWFGGPVYAAGGGGGGAGQGLPAGTAGAGAGGGGGTFYEEVSGSPFYVTTSGSESQVLQTMGIVATIDTVSANDATRTAGTYTIGASDYSAQGSGTGATFSIVIANNANRTVTVNITTGGSGYVVNNTITVAAAQIGGTGSALTFDVASISSLFTFKKGGSTVGSNTSGDAVIVGGGGVGTKRYVLFAENDDATSVETANPVVDNSPSNRIFRITEYEIISGGSSAGGGGTGSKTAGGNGGNGGERNQAHGGGGGGGGSNGTGGEGGNNNDGTNGTASSGGNGASGTHTGSIEGENNVTGSGGTGGASGAAIRRTSGITVNITNNGTITGSQTATGVS